MLRTAFAIMLLNAVSGCATPSGGEHTSRWGYEGSLQSIEVQPGLALRYLRVGEGQPLDLLHTIRTQLDYFEKLAPLLKDRYTVYIVDLPGHGQSTIAQVDYTEKYLREATVRFIEQLDLRNVVLTGESIGGVLALTASGEIPERIARVVSINPYDYGESFGGGIRRSSSGWIVGLFSIFGEYTLETRFFLEKVLRGGVHDPARFPDALVSELFNTGQRPGYRRVEYSVFESWRSWIDARAQYEKVRAPVTLVYLEFDWSSSNERNRNRQAFPNARHVLVSGAGHFSSLERPAEIAGAIDGSR